MIAREARPSFVPVAPADVELDRRAAAAARAEAPLREVDHVDARARDAARGLARHSHQLHLRELAAGLRVARALALLVHRDEHEPAVHFPAAEAADEAAVLLDLRPALEEALDLVEHAFGGLHARADRGLEAHPEAAHVLRGNELLPQQPHDPERGDEQHRGPDQHRLAVLQRRHQQALVAGREPREAQVDGPLQARGALAHLEHARQAHRRERERLEQRDQHRDRDRDAELEEELADDALHEGHRQEDRDDRGGRRGRGERDLARADRGGLHLALAVLAVAVDVLEHDDRIVDHDPDHQREPEHGVGVEREAEHVHHDEGPRIEVGIASSTLSVVDHEPRKIQHTRLGEQSRQHEREQDLLDRPLDEDRGVEVDDDEQALGQLLLDLGHLGAHVAAHLDRVRAAQLGDAEADGGLAHRAEVAAPVLEPVLHHRDVLLAAPARRRGR